jgi:hypothetical protein
MMNRENFLDCYHDSGEILRVLALLCFKTVSRDQRFAGIVAQG